MRATPSTSLRVPALSFYHPCGRAAFRHAAGTGLAAPESLTTPLHGATAGETEESVQFSPDTFGPARCSVHTSIGPSFIFFS